MPKKYFIVIQFVCLAFVSIDYLRAQELEFIPPDIGKFRKCDFSVECDLRVECDDVIDCTHLTPTIQDCKTVWRSQMVVLGIKTHVPEVLCNKIQNDALKVCLSEQAVASAKCRDRQSVERRECLEKANVQKAECELVRTAQIQAASELYEALVEASNYLSAFDGINMALDGKTLEKVTLKGEDNVNVKVLRSKDYGDFWAFFYDRKRFVDWSKIPTLGYSSYRTFVSIENYLILSPEFKSEPTPEMLKYTALNAMLSKNVGLDGMSQMYIHNPGYLEEYFVRGLARME